MSLRSSTATLLFVLSSLGLWPTGTASGQDRTPSPVPFQAIVRLAPENSKIEFVGTHVGEDPKPRLGGFSKFSGTIGVDLGKREITSIHVEMPVDSIWTEFDKLTAHLMNADFFEASAFPTAGFQSTRITKLQDGTCSVTGKLSLHGQVSEIVFPCSYEFSDDGLVLSSQFLLDRTEFGMDKMTDGVEKIVSISVSVGTPTRTVDASDGHGGESGESTSNGTDTPRGKPVTVYLPNMT